MTSAFNRVVSYDGSEWYERLDKMALAEIFKPVIEFCRSTDKQAYDGLDRNDLARGMVKYIAYAYSIESEIITIQSEWLKNKKQVFDYVNLPPLDAVQRDTIYLQEPAVLQSIRNWLSFQNEKAFTNYMMLKDLQQQMQEAALRPILKSSLEIDYSAKMDCAKYSVELASMIKDAESNLIQNNPKLKEAVGEVTKMSKAAKNTMGVENFV